jgi:hypothetical protein
MSEDDVGKNDGAVSRLFENNRTQFPANIGHISGKEEQYVVMLDFCRLLDISSNF